MLTFLSRGFGEGHLAGIGVMALLHGGLDRRRDDRQLLRRLCQLGAHRRRPVWAKVFAVLLIVVMTGLNIVGSPLSPGAVAHREVVLTILTVFFAAVTIATGTSPCSRRPAIRAAGDHRERGADVLRLPRLRCHHLHRQGPAGSGTGSCRRPCTSPWRSPPRSTSGVAGRVRHAHRRPGRGVRHHGPGRGRQAHARPVRLRPDGDHGAVLHGGRHQLRPLPVDRDDAAPRLGRAVPPGVRSDGRSAAFPVGLLRHGGTHPGLRPAVRPEQDRLDRQRGRAARLLDGHRGAPPSSDSRPAPA